MVTNNSIGLSSEGVPYYNGAGVFTGLDGNTAGFVLTSNGTNVSPAFKAVSSSGAITTIDGDTGSAIPAVGVLNIFATPASGSSVSFSASGNTVELNTTDASFNTIIGSQAGNSSISGSTNTSVGYQSLNGLTSGTGNTGFGDAALKRVTSGASNTTVGAASLNFLTTGSYNCSFGTLCLTALISGMQNCAFGEQTLPSLTTGSANTVLGFESGTSYTSSESNNVLLMNPGVTGESNVIRIGLQGAGPGEQNTCYIAGITGVTTSSSNYVTVNTSTGQLGATAIPGLTAWTDEAISFAAGAGNGYFITANATATLPASPTQGAIVAFAVDAAATTVTITANTGQIIRIGAAVSATAGTAANNARGDSVTLVFRSNDSAWIATSVIGTWSVT